MNNFNITILMVGGAMSLISIVVLLIDHYQEKKKTVRVNMQTIQLDIADDKLDTFLTIVGNLKNDIVQNIRLQDTLDIEPIEKDSADFLAIQQIKSENNPKYSIAEAKAKLGL